MNPIPLLMPGGFEKPSIGYITSVTDVDVLADLSGPLFPVDVAVFVGELATISATGVGPLNAAMDFSGLFAGSEVLLVNRGGIAGRGGNGGTGGASFKFAVGTDGCAGSGGGGAGVEAAPGGLEYDTPNNPTTVGLPGDPGIGGVGGSGVTFPLGLPEPPGQLNVNDGGDGQLAVNTTGSNRITVSNGGTIWGGGGGGGSGGLVTPANSISGDGGNGGLPGEAGQQGETDANPNPDFVGFGGAGGKAFKISFASAALEDDVVFLSGGLFPDVKGDIG